MKHLLLSGGKPTESEAWVRALLSHAGSEARIVLCLFASDTPELAQAVERGVADVITRAAGAVHCSFKTLTPENFTEASRWANIVVIPGGDPTKLQRELEPFGDLMELWDGKTISGSSAGADIMCRRYVYLQNKTFHEGFGWVAANCIPHWQAEGWKDWTAADWAWAAAELASQPGNAPLLTIREGEFVEIAVQ